jgi:hypothetical protein
MPTYDIILLTELRYEDPEKRNPYIENILLEDRILTKALEKRNFKVARFAWERKDIDWSDTRYILFRTPWNYTEKWDEFFTWFEHTQKKVTFINPVPIIKWNLDKHYLFDLEKKGVTIAKTLAVEKGSSKTLKEAINLLACDEVVIKPFISASARSTYRIKKSEWLSYETIFKDCVENEAMMVQEFQKSIPEKGEVSLMFFGKSYSHAVLKKAKKGDFRVQDDFDGTVHDYIASEEELAFAQHAISQIEILPTYSRVDLFRDNNGHLALGELELIEPELWFRKHEEAADLLADEFLKLRH